VRPNGTLLPIDEGEQERFEWVPGPLRPNGGDWVLVKTKPIKRALWVKYRKQLLQLIATTLRDRYWFEQWLWVTCEEIRALPEGIVRPYYAAQLKLLDEVVQETLCQIGIQKS
jgi:hypothetical protein